MVDREVRDAWRLYLGNWIPLLLMALLPVVCLVVRYASAVDRHSSAVYRGTARIISRRPFAPDSSFTKRAISLFGWSS